MNVERESGTYSEAVNGHFQAERARGSVAFSPFVACGDSNPACFHRTLGIMRGLDALRVHDALPKGASQRKIAAVLFGQERVASDWDGGTECLRTRIRRLAHDASAMARGGYRRLLRRGPAGGSRGSACGFHSFPFPFEHDM